MTLFRIFLASLSLSFVVPFAQALTLTELPSVVDTGQCFARVVMPEVTESFSERVEVTPAKVTLRTVPAVYRPEMVRVVVKEATTNYNTFPAVYETVTEQVMVEPERIERVSLPAQYETWTETIEIEPARLVWQTGSGLYGRDGIAAKGEIINPDSLHEVSTGEILCRVLVPAKTRTITRTRLVSEARTEDRVIPATYKTISRQVVREEARIEAFTTEAEYADIRVDVLVSAERVEEEIIPATYRTVERQRLVSKGGLQWAEVLCDTNSTGEKIAEIQRALQTRGYRLTADGVYGPQTQSAMEQFQRANQLAVGYMTVATVLALDVDPYI